MADTAAIKTAMEALAGQFDLKIVDEGKKEETEKSADSTPGADTPATDASETDPELKDAAIGSLNKIKDLYQGPEDSSGRAPWVDKYPEDVEEAAETEETAKYAFIARKKKCFTGRKKFDIDSIIVNSPAVKKVLEKVFDKYPGVTCSLDRLVFDAPFQPFVHRWSEFKLAIETEKNESTKTHLELLHKLLREELKDTIKALEDFILNGVTTFDILWAIFQPKCTVYSRTGGLPNCQSFYSGSYGEGQCGKYFQLTLEPIGWNGTAFKRGTEYTNIYDFQGTKPIKDLSACPLHLHPEQDNIRATLVKRGKKYEQFAGYHYKAYEGIALSWNAKGTQIPVTVTGRIIIDTESFDRNNPTKSSAYNDDLHPQDFKVSQTATMDFKKMVTVIQNDYEDEGDGPKIDLTDDGCLICKSTIPGYSLKQKKWMLFFVDFIKEIEWNENAFSTLVLPEDTKDLLMSFVESQVENKDTFDDVIQGKGKGIIMLLSGPPGVGKTLTAESVAESMRIPLYMMSAGDLGIRPDEVEDALQKILEMVAKWDAILLLDECDVFLEARTNSDLERNKLVSIFLRTLEYYEGILFLTTNRVANMDAAFQSRIHVSMEYPNLTADSRRQIWENFLINSKQKSEVSAEDLDYLSTIELNGRQIKNVLKTSFLLSMRKKMPLKREFIDIVLAIEGRRPRA
ncbi:ATPase [Hyaloscypha variabilis F]|uniref:ATPase n=1 Tax=Hyaloscypha variabilis (strain UAMH 11265 / GT02V1 / F) TaxID=1149755 RepID=A0A2J6REI2_HYAVF|nr:ATPase [Hyaloscypha variabilis F]